MKATFLTLLPALVLVAGAKPLPEKTVRQAAAKIDQLLEQDLKTAGLKPTARIDDATFLRRAYLGIIGRIPSHDEATRFLSDKSADKRHALIDELVASPGFDSHLFNWTADLLRVQTSQEQFGLGWHVWLRKSLAEDKPWDDMVREMLGSEGHTVSDPAVGYYLRDRNMQLDNFSNTMQVFLGRQIGCAQCHDHPFDDWSQYEYYQMAAFGGGFQYRSQEAEKTVRNLSMTILEKDQKKKAAPKADFAPANKAAEAKAKAAKMKAEREKKARAMRAERERKQQMQRKLQTLSRQFRPLFKDFAKNALHDNPSVALTLPEDYQYSDAKPGSVVSAETLFGRRLKDVAPEERRQLFAEWVSSPENPYFTKVIANRMWQRTFGHGLVDPVDDWDEDSETLHPEVLAYLETTMKGVDYDLRQFLRILFHTRLFERECLTEEPAMGLPLAFRGPALTRMSAEQIYDSFLVLTRGKVNDAPTQAFERKWDDYRKKVSDLLNAPARDMVILAESARAGEELRREAQSEQRAAQKKLAEAKTEEQRRQAQRELAKIREKVQEARMMAEPVMRYTRVGNGKRDSGLRASEHPTPFRAGTLVREFGGSDRETPSSAHTTATVPQALALLNDYQMDVFRGKGSSLGRNIEAIKSPEKRIETLFITLYATPPTEEEIERYSKFAEDRIALRDLARAMLTSNRFLFIQ
ncbi:hypothetical protein HAHE_14280 [Haloferula helveola]|uniref:DUF1549 domain-containing protein n=1 Tax=Haloferula helveola TaxID=490095 RepID=A0ABM7RCQ5_9BACT|nr:hypothetical protein HAHE_14280 [Haloferula helveola]